MNEATTTTSVNIIEENEKTQRWLVITAFATVYLLWGSTYIGIRIAIETIPPFWMAGWRQFLAGAILYGILWVKGEPAPKWMHLRDAAIVGAFLLLVQNGVLTWVEEKIPSGLCALIVAATPFWMILMNRILVRGSRLTIPILLGLVLGFAGVAIIVFAKDSAGRNIVDPFGAVILVLATISWAAGSSYSRMARTPKNPLQSTALQLMSGGTMLLATSVIRGEPASFHISAVSHSSAVAFVYLCLFGSLVGYTAYAWLLKASTIAKVSTTAFVNPLVAVVLGSVIGHETMSPAILVAGALIIGAVMLIVRKK